MSGARGYTIELFMYKQRGGKEATGDERWNSDQHFGLSLLQHNLYIPALLWEKPRSLLR